MRNLAEIVTVKAVEDIEYNGKRYDNIVRVTLNENAFDFTTQRGVNPGDMMVLIGEGALIPASRKEFEFLRARCYREKYDAFAIKPMKLAGIISMGLLMPLSVLPKKAYRPGARASVIYGYVTMTKPFAEKNIRR